MVSSKRHLIRNLRTLLLRFAILLGFAVSVAAKGGGGRSSSSSSGSSGRGSRSYHDDSSYGYSSGSGGGECDKTCGMLRSVALGLIFGCPILMILCIVGGQCAEHLFRNIAMAKEIRKAEQYVMEDAAKGKPDNNNNNKPVITIEKSTFEASYYDTSHEGGSLKLTSSGNFYFQKLSSNKAPNVRNISGTGRDSDGPYNIKRGAVSIWSGKAYWVEQARGSKIKTLVRGTFSKTGEYSDKLGFNGLFQCNNKAKGRFDTFTVTPFGHQDVVEPKADVEIDVVGDGTASSTIEQQTPPPPYYAAGTTTISTTTTSSAVSSGVPSMFGAPVPLAAAPAHPNPPPATVPPAYKPATVITTNDQNQQPIYKPEPIVRNPCVHTVPSIFRPPA